MVEMATILAVSAVASSAAAAGTAVMSAQASRAAGSAQRQQAQIQAQAISDQAQQVRDAAAREEAQRLETLNRVLSTTAAIRGAAGVTMDSAGASALIQDAEQTTRRDIDTIRVNAEREARSLGLAGQRALLSGQAAEIEARGRAGAAYGSAVQSIGAGARSGYNYLSQPRRPEPVP